MTEGRTFLGGWFQLTTIYMPMLGMMKLNLDDEGGGSDDGGAAELDAMFGTNDSTASLDGGKADDAPDGGKDASGGEEGGKADGAPPDDGKAPVVSDEDLEKALSPEESPEEKAARLERDYKASSTEAQRLNAEKKAIAKSLEEQGLKLVVKNGKAELIPTEKYTPDGRPLEVKISDMSAADQEALESGDLAEIQKVIDKVVSDARSKLVRPAPTLEKEPATISPERKESVFSSLEAMTDELGNPKHPDFAMNRKFIETYINNPANPQALRDAFAAAPEAVAVLVNSHINSTRQALIKRTEAAKAASEKKEKEARQKASRGIEDDGIVTHGGDDSFYDQFGPRRFG